MRSPDVAPYRLADFRPPNGVMYHRFTDGRLDGHSFRNILIATLTSIRDFDRGGEIAGQLLAIRQGGAVRIQQRHAGAAQGRDKVIGE